MAVCSIMGSSGASLMLGEASTVNLAAQGSEAAESSPLLKVAKFHQTHSDPSNKLVPTMKDDDDDIDQPPHEEDPAPGSCNRKPKGVHITVQHHYHDHLHDRSSDYVTEHPARGGVATPFPLKLHDMLENVQHDGYEDIVSWQQHGRCFIVHKPKEFVKLLPRYFKLSKLASFQRQLNLYGFQRLTRGRDRGGYYHELFLKGMDYLAHDIHRVKVKGTWVRARSNPDQEPDLWGMDWIPEGIENIASCSVGTPSPTKNSMISNKRLSSSAAVKTFLTSSIVPMVSPIHVPSSRPTMYGNNPNLSIRSSHNKDLANDDMVCAFGNKTFHYLDPFHPISVSRKEEQDKNYLQQLLEQPLSKHQDELLNAEAESFFTDFQFPDDIGAEIENDIIFGDLLETLVR